MVSTTIAVSRGIITFEDFNRFFKYTGPNVDINMISWFLEEYLRFIHFKILRRTESEFCEIVFIVVRAKTQKFMFGFKIRKYSKLELHVKKISASREFIFAVSE